MDKKLHKMAVAALIFGVLAMNEDPTTVIVQRYLDALPGDAAAEPVIRELLGPGPVCHQGLGGARR